MSLLVSPAGAKTTAGASKGCSAQPAHDCEAQPARAHAQVASATQKLLDARYIAEPSAIAPMVRELAKPGDFVVFLGAGSITQWAYALPKELAAGEEAAA